MGNEIECQELLRVNESKVGERTFVVRVVRWNRGRPRLEKRETYQDKATNETRFGKCLGLDDEDMQLIMQRYDEVDAALTPKEKSRGKA